MKNWVLNRVIPSCSACCRLAGVLICLTGLVLEGCATSKLSKEDRLVDQYQRAIGCQDYGRLRPAKGGHDAILTACTKSLKKEFSTAEVITAFVYRSLNKGILFVHMVYRLGPGDPREGYNYLVAQDGAAVLGGYRCGPG